MTNTRTSKEILKEEAANIDKLLGEKIKVCRIVRKFSQSDCAEHLGITFQQFQKYETGKNRIPISRLMKLADFLSIKTAVFFEDNSIENAMKLLELNKNQ